MFSFSGRSLRHLKAVQSCETNQHHAGRSGRNSFKNMSTSYSDLWGSISTKEGQTNCIWHQQNTALILLWLSSVYRNPEPKGKKKWCGANLVYPSPLPPPCRGLLLPCPWVTWLSTWPCKPVKLEHENNQYGSLLMYYSLHTESDLSCCQYVIHYQKAFWSLSPRQTH